jgi:hypothetical protein
MIIQRDGVDAALEAVAAALGRASPSERGMTGRDCLVATVAAEAALAASGRARGRPLLAWADALSNVPVGATMGQMCPLCDRFFPLNQPALGCVTRVGCPFITAQMAGSSASG